MITIFIALGQCKGLPNIKQECCNIQYYCVLFHVNIQSIAAVKEHKSQNAGIQMQLDYFLSCHGLCAHAHALPHTRTHTYIHTALLGYVHKNRIYCSIKMRVNAKFSNQNQVHRNRIEDKSSFYIFCILIILLIWMERTSQCSTVTAVQSMNFQKLDRRKLEY